MSDRAAIFYYVAVIKDDGDAIPLELTRRVKAFQFIDREAGMDRLRLTINNSDLSNFDDPVFERGGKLRCAFGNGQSAAPPRDMVIKKVTGGRTLTIEAVTVAGLAMDTEKKRRCFANVRRSDVVRKLAKEHGFNNPDIEETPEVFEELGQSNLSDGQLLRKLAHLEGFEFFIDWSGLHWHRRRAGQAPAREYIYFVDPLGGEILDFNVTNDVTRRPGKVTVKSRDPLGKTDIEASASNSEDGDRDVMQGVTATIDKESGELSKHPEIAYEQTVASNVESQQDADREAKGKFRKAAQGVVKLTLKLRGDPSLVAKTIITVHGMGKRISGKYYVKEITHTLDSSSGYTMDVKLITDGFQSRGGGAGSAGGEGAGAIPSLAANLELALAADYTASIDGESGNLSTNGDKINAIAITGRTLVAGLKVLATQDGDQLRTNAGLAAKALVRLASNARAAGMLNTVAAASEAAATLAHIAESPDEVPAKGRINDKTKADSEVIPIETIDEDGNPVTTYVDQNGRAIS